MILAGAGGVRAGLAGALVAIGLESAVLWATNGTVLGIDRTPYVVSTWAMFVGFGVGSPLILGYLAALQRRARAAEDRLGESEERFLRLVENAGDAFFLHEVDGKIMDVTQRACDSLGYSRDELLTLSIRDIELNFDEDNIRERWVELEPNVPTTLEGVHRRKDRSTFPVEVRLVRFQWAGRPVFLALARDLTERKSLEEQLIHSQKMEAVGTLAGGVAHDFNNLLSAVIGYAQLALMKHSVEEPVAGYLQEIQTAAERGASLTQQLLAFSHRQVVEPRVVNLNALVLDLDRMLRHIMGEDVELVTLQDPELGMVRVDPGQMGQVLINIAANARDAMPDGGKLVIETANVVLGGHSRGAHADLPAGDYARLSIRDTGTGMADYVKERAFEPFFTTKEVGQGSGLGLSTCYGIVGQAGGHIFIDSELGAGTTFTIYLPRVEGPASRRPSSQDRGELPAGTEAVLLVEDEPMVRTLAATVLRERGYRVFEATNGAEALQIAHEWGDAGVDLVLTDVVMPLMGGEILVRHLREMYPGTKVLYTSGYIDVAIANHDLLEPGTDFMQKPFTPAVLARKVRETLDA